MVDMETRRELQRAWVQAASVSPRATAERAPWAAASSSRKRQTWPETRARRGWLVARATCAGLTREAVDGTLGASDEDGGLDAWFLPKPNELVVAAPESKATFKCNPRWEGYLLVQQVRMVIAFTAEGTEMELRVRRRYEGVARTIFFLAFGACGVTFGIQEALECGPRALLVGLPFLVSGLVFPLALWRRWVQIRRELALLREAWARLCSECAG